MLSTDKRWKQLGIVKDLRQEGELKVDGMTILKDGVLLLDKI